MGSSNFEYDPFCAVCGVPFGHVQLQKSTGDISIYDYSPQILSPAQFEWTLKFRILAETVKDGHFVAQNRSLNPDIVVSDQGSWQCDENWFDDAPYWVDENYEANKDGIVSRFNKFTPIHDACLTLLKAFTKHQRRIRSSHWLKIVENFVDACKARPQICKDFAWRASTKCEITKIPPGYPRPFSIEWSHLYLGARRFWADPWDCALGMEHLCADPLKNMRVKEFILACLNYSPPTESPVLKLRGGLSKNAIKKAGYTVPPDFKVAFLNLLPHHPEAKHPETRHSETYHFTQLERTMEHVASKVVPLLPLRSALNLLSCFTLAENRLYNFVCHMQAVRLHGHWFPELKQFSHSSDDLNWAVLLRILETNRLVLLAEGLPYWRGGSSGQKRVSQHEVSKLSQLDLPSMPVGLKNRQRIWMCLEFADVNEAV